ncbi:MAG: hypothetical protein KAR65_07175 [Anaerolineales bacterium]|nr:hypothetical protein [Anaerolineales bacterium]MCK5633826.1 hypothetical protein [Anaerolineales bacterium]
MFWETSFALTLTKVAETTKEAAGRRLIISNAPAISLLLQPDADRQL